MLNRKELEMQRSELLWSLSGTHTLLVFRLPCHCRVQQLFNPVNVLISIFLTELADRLTDRLTDGQNRLLNHACAHGVKILIALVKLKWSVFMLCG